MNAEIQDAVTLARDAELLERRRMSNIKAIETIYNGYRFRSRLEARWAVFLDEMGIKYEYEHQGYDVGGVKYLPDFHLPDFSLAVEVKPNLDITRASWEKIVSLAADGDHPLLLVVGSPGDHDFYLCDRTTLSIWAEYDQIEDSAYLSEVILEGLRDWGHVRFGAVPFHRGWQLTYLSEPPLTQCNRDLAIAAARQSRFEHGQKGAPKA